MLLVTPTFASSAIAGAGLGLVGWSAILKSDRVPGLKRLMTTDRKERTLTWMNHNKGLSLLGLEAVNFGVHGVVSPNAVALALGNTAVNIVTLWLYLPLRQWRVGRTKAIAILKGVTAA